MNAPPTATRPPRADRHLYVGFAGADTTVRHLSLLPLMDDLAAVCGLPLLHTMPATTETLLRTLSCNTCRSIMVQRVH